MPSFDEVVGDKVKAAIQSADQMKSVFAGMRAKAGAE